MGNVRFGRKYRKSKKKPRQYHHLYPSTMGRLTIREILNSVHSILFSSSDAEKNRQILLKERHNPYRYTDSSCLPFRYRHMVDCYQMTASGQGFTLNLVVHVPSRTVTVTIINQESPNGEYITGKLMRRKLSQLGIPGFQSYPEESHELTESNKEHLLGRYKTYRSSILSNLHNFRLGGGLQIKEKNDRLYVTNIPDGYYSQSTRMSYRHHLRPILQDEDRLVLAYDDGLHISKFVVPSLSKASSMYAEIDMGATLYLKSFQANIALINLKDNLDYILYTKIIPRITQSYRGLWALIRKREITSPKFEALKFKPSAIYKPSLSESAVEDHISDHSDVNTIQEVSVQNASMVATKQQMDDLLTDMDLEPIIEPVENHEAKILEAELVDLPAPEEIAEHPEETLEQFQELTEEISEEEPPVRKKKLRKKPQAEQNKVVEYVQIGGKHLLLTPFYLLIVLKGFLLALPSFTRPFRSRFIGDTIQFIIFLMAGTFATMTWLYRLISQLFSSFANVARPYVSYLARKLDFFGKPKEKTYGFDNHLKELVKSRNKDALTYLHNKNPKMTSTLIRGQKSITGKYGESVESIKKYNQRFPMHLTLDGKGLSNLERFVRHHFRQFNFQAKLSPKLYERIASIFSTLLQKRTTLRQFRRYSRSVLETRRGVKSQKSTENEVGKHSLVLAAEQSQYTQILIDHGITSNEQLSKTTIRRLLTIPGITPELANKILREQV